MLPRRYITESVKSFLFKGDDRHSGEAFFVLDQDDNNRRIAMVDRRDEALRIADLMNRHGGPA